MDSVLIILACTGEKAGNMVCSQLQAILQKEGIEVQLETGDKILQKPGLIKETVIFVFPLLMESVPSEVLALWEKIASCCKGLYACAVIHNGLLEAGKGISAAAAFHSFCKSSGALYGGTFCIGTDWMTDQLIMRLPFSSRLRQFAKAVMEKRPADLKVQALWSRDAFCEANRKNWEKRGREFGCTKAQMDISQISRKT